MEPSPVNSQNPGKAAVVTDDERLLAAKAELLQFRQKQTEYFLKAASKILQLKDGLRKTQRDTLISWLRTEVGFSGAEVRSYFECDESLMAQQDVILANRLSPDVLRALVKCDEGARTECLVKARRGEHIDARRVGEIREFHRAAAMSAERTARRLRARLFGQASRRLGAEAKVCLEKNAATLAAMLPDEGTVDRFHEERTLSGSEKLRDTVIELARGLRKDVESMFPDLKKEPALLSNSGVAGVSVVEAWNVLRKLEIGVVQLRSQFDGRKTRSFLEFIAGTRSSALSSWKEASIAPRIGVPPTFVDIDAGVGGTVLGLQAAGFEPAAVFAGEKACIEAIASNKPSWRPRDVSELASMQDSFGAKEVDLVTSGLPWHHHKAFRKDKCGRAQRAVKAIRPKYFLFETLAKDIGDMDLKKPFEEAGYDVAWHSLDVRSYGIAQAKRRVVMVGARKELLGNFSIPVIHPPRPCSLAQAMGDLVDGYISEATSNAEMTVDTKTRQRLLDDISKWRELWKHECAPDLPVPGVSRKRNAWKDLGIDITGYDNNPPSLEKLGTGFQLTNDMLKRIHGFPDHWDVGGTSSSNSKLLESAFPPVVAKLLGLAIHSALAGVEFDYRRAAASRMLHLKQSLVNAGPLGNVLEYRPPGVSEFIVGPHLAFKDRELQRTKDRVKNRRRSRQRHDPALIRDGAVPVPSND
ncbi:DNA cytosine methyltransferase [Rhizobium leguminosarum]|uniref:DNA cytosine methyltransferase n=1 Tax=Rhizobium leguminosarum TaxID=384 RepID=UPI001C97D786|nr:DNA cytosine methyltransferase [Rhizobium leguminosarum]MBY5716675.1 DNA cytosine methyltransferase [Rhizobium leguminosarum]